MIHLNASKTDCASVAFSFDRRIGKVVRSNSYTSYAQAQVPFWWKTICFCDGTQPHPDLWCAVFYYIHVDISGDTRKKIPLAGLIDVWCPLQQLGPFVVEKDAVAHFMIMAVAIQSSMGGGWFSRIGTLVSSIAHVFFAFGFWVSARTTHHY